MTTPRASRALAHCLFDMPRDAERVGRVQRIIPGTARDRAAIAGRLDGLASRIGRNIPLGSDPGRFHEEKSDIARELRTIADELRR